MPNSTSPPKTPLEQPGVPPSVAARLEAAATFSSVVSATPSILLHAATLRRVEDQPPPDFHRAIGDPAAEVHLAPGKGASPRLSPRVPLPGEDGAFDADAEFELLTTPAINAPVLADRRLSVQGSTAGFLLDEAATPAGHRPPTPVFRPSSPPIAPTPSGTGNDLLIPPPRPATPISSWLEPHVSPLVAPSPLSAPPVVPAARFATPGDDYVPYDLDHHVEGDNATWHEHEPEPVPITSETSAVPDVASVGHDLTSKGKMSGDAGIGAERTRRYLVKKKPMGVFDFCWDRGIN